MLNKKILLLGATGQIGKELSLYLMETKNIDLVCHARTRVSAIFLINLKINCIICDFKDEELKKEIKTADLIFDLVAPSSGNLDETKKFYKDRLDYLMENMPPKTKFVFASSMNAFGLSIKNNELKNYMIPASIYAANKRFAEGIVINEAKKRNIDSYVVRFPDVHGKFQRVSGYIKGLISNNYIFEIPKTPAWIVFISTIHEMLISIIENNEKPGRYTLVNDEIYWPDLLEYFGKKINKKVKYRILRNDNENYFQKLSKYMYSLILSRRDLIRGNFSISKEFEASKKIEYGVIKANDAYRKLEGQKIYDGLNLYKGILPGNRFKNLTLKKEIIFKINDNIKKDFS